MNQAHLAKYIHSGMLAHFGPARCGNSLRANQVDRRVLELPHREDLFVDALWAGVEPWVFNWYAKASPVARLRSALTFADAAISIHRSSCPESLGSQTSKT